MLILPICLNQVLTNEKSEKSEKAIFKSSSGPQRNLKKLVASVHCAYASKDKMVGIFYFIPKVTYL
jgi:hypothetical protein